jgi:hypothetical protein
VVIKARSSYQASLKDSQTLMQAVCENENQYFQTDRILKETGAISGSERDLTTLCVIFIPKATTRRRATNKMTGLDKTQFCLRVV